MKPGPRRPAASPAPGRRPGGSERAPTRPLGAVGLARSVPRPAAAAEGGPGPAAAPDLPGLDPVDLDRGLAALGLGLDEGQRSQLLAYLGLLRRWNSVYNLTALRAPGEMVSHHLLDCLAVLPPLLAHGLGPGPAPSAAAGSSGPILGARTGQVPSAEAGLPPVSTPAPAPTAAAATMPAPSTAVPVASAMPAPGACPAPGPRQGEAAAGCAILDVGSGGGLPGVVLAICRPDWSVTCVDTVAKKASFIRQVAAELRLPRLAAQHARVEALEAASPQRYQVITARAFSSLPDLVRLTRALLAPGGVWMAMKGAVPEDEIRALPPDVEVFHVEQLAVPGLAAQRCLVWMRPRADRA